MEALTMQVIVDTLLPVPLSPARDGDAGIDLMNVGGTVSIGVQTFTSIPSGIRVKIPAGHFGMITGRSSTFAKKGLIVPTSIIDEGYVGPIYVIAFNPGVGGAREVRVETGERIAQLLVLPYAKVNATVVGALPETQRGSNGFGSTG